MASKALQVPKGSQSRALWYVTSSIAFFLPLSLRCSQLEPVSEVGVSSVIYEFTCPSPAAEQLERQRWQSEGFMLTRPCTSSFWPKPAFVQTLLNGLLLKAAQWGPFPLRIFYEYSGISLSSDHHCLAGSSGKCCHMSGMAESLCTCCGCKLPWNTAGSSNNLGHGCGAAGCSLL